jgi:hypothetical protein
LNDGAAVEGGGEVRAEVDEVENEINVGVDMMYGVELGLLLD